MKFIEQRFPNIVSSTQTNSLLAISAKSGINQGNFSSPVLFKFVKIGKIFSQTWKYNLYLSSFHFLWVSGGDKSPSWETWVTATRDLFLSSTNELMPSEKLPLLPGFNTFLVAFAPYYLCFAVLCFSLLLACCHCWWHHSLHSLATRPLNTNPAGCRSNQCFDARPPSALFLMIRRDNSA